jgi:hypothetical protein
MSTQQKKSQYTRADVSWPVFLLTPQCIVKGETKNISLGGAFIHFLSDPVQDRSFRLVIKPPKYEGLLVVSAEVAWMSRQQQFKRILPTGMGVQFTHISGSARDFLHSVFSCSF